MYFIMARAWSVLYPLEVLAMDKVVVWGHT